jgi:hypothetical protein
MISFRPIEVATSEGGGGYLVLEGERLVAVIVELSALHGDKAGCWYVEAQFGPLEGPPPLPFATLDAVEAWVARRLGSDA